MLKLMSSSTTLCRRGECEQEKQENKAGVPKFPLLTVIIDPCQKQEMFAGDHFLSPSFTLHYESISMDKGLAPAVTSLASGETASNFVSVLNILLCVQ